MTKFIASDGCFVVPALGAKRDRRCEHGYAYISQKSLRGGSDEIGEPGGGPGFAVSRRHYKKRSEANRDWTDARTKVDLEGRCRKCHAEPAHLEAAHLVGRKHDEPHPDGTKRLWVNPDRIVPLCPDCHSSFDSHQLDLLGNLSVEEQLRAVSDCGSLESARRRLAPSAYVESLAS